MDNTILLLGSTQEAEEELLFAKSVIKSVMRKFRKSVRFNHIARLIVNECEHSVAAHTIVSEEIARHSAVLWGSNEKSRSDDMAYFQDMLGVYAYEYYVAGRCIIVPAYSEEHFSSADAGSDRRNLSRINARAACLLAFETAKKRKRHLTVCSGSKSSENDKLLLREFENEAVRLRNVDVEMLSADEIIWKHLKMNPFTDVILSGEPYSHMLTLQISSSMRSSGGYICCRSPQTRIYCRSGSPYEYTNNGKYARIILAAAAMLENEIGASQAAVWMRRAVGIADERSVNATSQQYCAEVMKAIEQKIRNRKK